MEKINVIHHMNEFRKILSYATNIGFFFLELVHRVLLGFLIL